MRDIEIKDGRKNKCDKCQKVYSVENDNEILFRNVALLHIDKNTKQTQIVCRNCKNKINKVLDVF